MWEVMAASSSESHDAADAGLHLCELYTLRGQPVRAELLSWLTARQDDDEPLLREMAAGAQALLARELGNQYVAHRHALDAAQLCVARIGLRDPTVRWCWPLAVEMALASDQVEAAESALRIVADAPPGQAPPYLLAQLSRYRGLVAARRGATGGVETHLTEAVGAMSELGYPYWQARAQLDLGHWFADQERVSEAVLMLTPAKETFERLGAGPDLDNARGVLRDLSPATDESHT